VDNNVGTGLQISPGAFLDAGALLGQTCAARRVGKASTFARAGRKGGLPPSPDRPLSSGSTQEPYPRRLRRGPPAAGRRAALSPPSATAGRSRGRCSAAYRRLNASSSRTSAGLRASAELGGEAVALAP
jgi:hypothetical protein